MCIIDTLLSAINPMYNMAQEIRVEKAMDDYKNEQLLKEAKNASENAGWERQQSIEEAREKRLQAILNMGEHTNEAAVGNIAVNSLTVLNQKKTDKLNGELDALSSLKNGERRAKNYINQADKLYSEYSLGKYNSKQKVRRGLTQITKNAVSTAATIAGGLL